MTNKLVHPVPSSLTGVRYENDWTASHMRGVLLSFRTMAEGNDEIMKNLEGKKVIKF